MSINNSNKFSFSLFKETYKDIYNIQGLDELLVQIRSVVAGPLGQATLVSNNENTTKLAQAVQAFLAHAECVRTGMLEVAQVPTHSLKGP